jgi:hypothetical protein
MGSGWEAIARKVWAGFAHDDSFFVLKLAGESVPSSQPGSRRDTELLPKSVMDTPITITTFFRDVDYPNL